MGYEHVIGLHAPAQEGGHTSGETVTLIGEGGGSPAALWGLYLQTNFPAEEGEDEDDDGH